MKPYFLLFLLFASDAFAGDWSDITFLLQRPTTLSQFINRLPDEYFRYNTYTYVTQSQSPEKALISFASPRAILFGTDAKVIIAFEDQGNSPLRERAEAIRALDDGSFEFFEIEFGSTPRLIPETDHRCARCHEGKPIWGAYRDWKGTFGPQSDLQWVVRDLDGYFKYLSFVSAQKKSPIYSRPIAGIRGDNSPVNATDLVPGRPDFRPRDPYVPGEGDFLDSLVPNQAKYVFSRLRSSQVYEKYKTLIAAEFLGCSLSQSIENEISRALAATFSAGELAELNQASGVFNKRALRLELIGRAMGVTTNDWSMAFEPTRANDVDHRVGFTLGSGVTIADYVFRELSRDVSIDRPDVQSVFSTPRWANPYYSYLDPIYQDRIPDGYPKNFSAECTALIPHVEEDLAKESNRIQFAPEELKLVGATSLVVQCLTCHTGKVPKAPLIPFSDPAQLLPWKARLRTQVSNGLMPKDRMLTDAQKAYLLREID